MKYKYIYNSTSIVRLLDNAIIPADLNNTDYVAFLKWVDGGNTPGPADLPPAPTWEQIRSQRDALLKDSDWSAFADANPKPSKEAWLTYRQSLRDIPSTFKSPEEVIWPEKPQ